MDVLAREASIRCIQAVRTSVDRAWTAPRRNARPSLRRISDEHFLIRFTRVRSLSLIPDEVLQTFAESVRSIDGLNPDNEVDCKIVYRSCSALEAACSLIAKKGWGEEAFRFATFRHPIVLKVVKSLIPRDQRFQDTYRQALSWQLADLRTIIRQGVTNRESADPRGSLFAGESRRDIPCTPSGTFYSLEEITSTLAVEPELTPLQVNVLGEFGGQEEIAPLENLLSTASTGEIALVAIHALASIGGPRAVRALSSFAVRADRTCQAAIASNLEDLARSDALLEHKYSVDDVQLLDSVMRALQVIDRNAVTSGDVILRRRSADTVLVMKWHLAAVPR